MLYFKGDALLGPEEDPAGMRKKIRKNKKNKYYSGKTERKKMPRLIYLSCLGSCGIELDGAL